MSEEPITLSLSAREQLSEDGVLKVGIAVGPAASALWAVRDKDTNEPAGVTVDLGAAMAARFGLKCAYVIHASSAEIIESATERRWTVAFTPVDAERKLMVDFGPNYYLGDSTYMVRGDSDIRNLSDVDCPGVRVFGVEGTATLRSARKSLSHNQAAGVTSMDEVLDLFARREADAIALGRESLLNLRTRFPEARILDGHFHATGTAVAVPKNRRDALGAASQFIEAAKQDGTLRKIFDKNGMGTVPVPPIGSMS